MWANWETVALAEWLRGHNERHIKKDKVGFYGLDVYSLWESFDEVLKYLENKDLTIKRPP
jgi:erythromycin esterase-like protein